VQVIGVTGVFFYIVYSLRQSFGEWGRELMKRLMEMISLTARRLFEAVARFPLTVVCLLAAAIILCYMISLHKAPELIIEKLMFTLLFGAFLGVTAQFACERFERLSDRRLVVYILSFLLTAGYLCILLPAPSISFEVTIRTVVAVFAMFCAFIWIPSYKDHADFNTITLIHFKSAAISVLYSGVLAMGCAAIIATIDSLLFDIHYDAYSYMMTIVWVLFAPIYYLSLLPRFNSQAPDDREYAQESGQYPRFLEILVSYIAIVLVAVYTLVLIAYFFKILFTLNWPSGQLGPMVLGYSAAGLFIYILSSLLENRLAVWYRLIFPRVLIPIVIMQLISVVIRLNAYGVTESRYYVAMFGIFCIIGGVVLSLKPVSRNGVIAVLAAVFAIVSVIPPIDAFTVSRTSQTNRIENMLRAENLLVDGKITPKADASHTLKLECTNILSYLQSRGYIKYIEWLPQDFNVYSNMEEVFGFRPTYERGENDYNYFFADLSMEKALNISDYDVLMSTNSYWRVDNSDQPTATFDFEVRGVPYQLTVNRLSSTEVRVAVKDGNGAELVATGLYEFIQSLSKTAVGPKDAMDPEEMTFGAENNGYKLRILLQSVHEIKGAGPDTGVDYSFFVMFGAPQ
jgi:hypothetical protein